MLTSTSIDPGVISEWLTGVTLDSLLPSIVTLGAGVFLVRGILKLVDKSMRKAKLENVARSLIRSVLKVLLYALVILMAASRLGIDVSGVVALASVASLALSLSLQDALSNVIGGFTLLSTHPFRSGDYVEIAGQAGTVQSIDITYTKLTTIDNKVISIPNASVVASSVINYSATGSRRIDILIRAAYHEDPQAVKAALLAAAADVPTVLTEPIAPLAAIRSYGESNIEYILQVWTQSPNYWKTTFAVNENIKRELDAAGIKLTYPHVNVHLDK